MEFKHAEGIASSLYKLDAEALREALQITADDQTIDEKKFIELLVTKQSEVVKDRDQRGYQRAQKEVLTKLEKDLRTKYPIDDAELKGADLIDKIIELQKEDVKVKGKPKELSDDDVKKHPLYLELEKAKAKEVTETKKHFEEIIAKDQESRNYESLLSEVDKNADKIFQSLGDAVLPEDATIAAKHKQKLLYEELRQIKWQKTGEDLIALKEDGSRYEDKAGNAKTFGDIVAEIAKNNFVFKQSQERKGPGNGNEGKDDKKVIPAKFTGQAPKTGNDYVALLQDSSLSVEVKQEIRNAYGPQFANG